MPNLIMLALAVVIVGVIFLAARLWVDALYRKHR